MVQDTGPYTDSLSPHVAVIMTVHGSYQTNLTSVKHMVLTTMLSIHGPKRVHICAYLVSRPIFFDVLEEIADKKSVVWRAAVKIALPPVQGVPTASHLGHHILHRATSVQGRDARAGWRYRGAGETLTGWDGS